LKSRGAGLEAALNRTQLHGLLGFSWGILGISILLISAIYRLSQIVLDTFSYPLAWYHWILLVFSILSMAYFEGYKGFQLKFSPRFAARCLFLRDNPRFLHSLLAPLFCMGFFYATRKRKITTLVLTLMIIALIQLAHMLAQPWRGILDAGVVIGLSWGLLSVYYCLQQTLSGRRFYGSADLPN